ncbi:MAG: hypothetical protein J1E16_01055 [Muribaculaceae bacterium]|nr:hypothetical protein [Muribaculaceae bacterium]
MKKTFTTLAAFMLLSSVSIPARAQDFVVPEPTFTIPLGGEAELLYNMFQVTWGYYGLIDNVGEDPITCTLTKPSGEVKTVNGIITDANMEGTQEGKAPTYVDNALMFRNFMSLNDDMQLIQEYGTYKVNIPAGVVLVNGVENPEANLEFTIIGLQEEAYMPKAEMVYPASPYTSYAFSLMMNWEDQEISFVEEGVEKVTLDADLDGKPVGCSASIQQVEGGNEDGTGMFTMQVLNIVFDDVLSYTQGTYLTVQIPAGLVTNGTEINEAQDVELYLYPQIEGKFSPEGGASLNSDEAFVTVTWEGIELQSLQGNKLTARNISANTDEEVEVSFGEGASITIDLTTLEEGKYEIIIPEAFVTILIKAGLAVDDYAINSEMYQEYTILKGSGGIENIPAENGIFDVYSIDGKSIVKSGDASAVEALGKGIYVINGKKVIIK